MNLTEEIIIAEPIIEDEEIYPQFEVITQEDIDSLPDFWEGEDPFAICPECERLGYCKRELVLQDSTICNLIPISVEGEYYRHTGEYSKKHLQAAFEAFHQKDYETAILNSQIVLKENRSIADPFLVIAVSQYFLHDLAEALSQYGHYLNTLESISEEHGVWLMRFIWHCENKLSALQGR